MILKNQKYNYLLFGNPVKHSKSPVIYKIFSELNNFNCNYHVYCVDNKLFKKNVLTFFNHYGQGANVTVPFKEEAYNLSDILTDRAKVSRAVNVLKKSQDNKIIGDNTDGIGCIYDLKRLNFIKSKQKILLIGAGGAARGIIPNILSLNCSIDIVNRTFQKSYYMECLFKHVGKIKAIDINSLKVLNYNLIINSTSIRKNDQFDRLMKDVNFCPKHTMFYDLNYNSGITAFLYWCLKHGAVHYSDGIGMLIGQAAYSFYLWSSIFPDVTPVFKKLDKKNIIKLMY